MIKLTRAMELIQTNIENLLTDAGLVDGLTINESELEKEDRVIYWNVQVTSEKASNKKEYLVWNYARVEPFVHGDGQSLVYEFELNISLYSKSSIMPGILSDIGDKLIENGYLFSLDRKGYDTTSQLYIYSFIAQSRVSE